MATKVITNNVPREIIDGYRLSMSARAEFDYLDWQAIKEGRESASFFRYKGQLYDLGDFQRIEYDTTAQTDGNPLKGWHGYQSDSFFSGILVRYTDDNEMVIVGHYVS